ALGRRYALKFDQFPRVQPEVNTAADAIVSRLYWAVGFNAPCNTIVYVAPDALRLGAGAYLRDAFGHRRPLTAERLRAITARGVHRSDGALRATASLFIDGEPLGPWASGGQREDDPNDVI